MRTKTSLLGAAGLSILLGCGMTSAAHAATSRDAQIELLQAEILQLTQRLNAQEAAQQQTQAAAQAAVAQAQATQQAADSQIKTIPTQVQTAMAALPKPKEGWWGSTSISGRMYYDITSIDDQSNGVKVPGGPNGVNFDIKRFYIGIDHKFNDVYSANVTTDFTYDSGPAGATQLYLKKAYLQAKLSDAFTVRLGSADLPWVPFVEDLYGNRYVENVMIDRDKFGTSADWGVHALGKFPAGPAMISYQVSAVDGAGYKKPGIGTANRSKGIDVEGRLAATVSDFTVAVGGYTGKLGKDVQGTPTYNNATRFDALAAYSNKRFKLGVEYFRANDWNDVTQANPLLTNSSEGYSAFGSIKIASNVGVFGRYDWVKPKDDTSPTLRDNYYNVGISYSPVKIVDFALVYKHDKVENGSIATSNGTIGGSNDGTYNEIGLFSQLRW